MEGEASLYGRRWRSNSTVQARRCESTGNVLSREGIRGDVTDSDRKKQTVKHGQANNTQRGVKMFFGSMLDGAGDS